MDSQDHRSATESQLDRDSGTAWTPTGSGSLMSAQATPKAWTFVAAFRSHSLNCWEGLLRDESAGPRLKPCHRQDGVPLPLQATLDIASAAMLSAWLALRLVPVDPSRYCSGERYTRPAAMTHHSRGSRVASKFSCAKQMAYQHSLTDAEGLCWLSGPPLLITFTFRRQAGQAGRSDKPLRHGTCLDTRRISVLRPTQNRC